MRLTYPGARISPTLWTLLWDSHYDLRHVSAVCLADHHKRDGPEVSLADAGSSLYPQKVQLSSFQLQHCCIARSRKRMASVSSAQRPVVALDAGAAALT